MQQEDFFFDVTLVKERKPYLRSKHKTLALFPILRFHSYSSYMADPACHRYDNSRHYHHHHRFRQCKKSSYEASEIISLHKHLLKFCVFLRTENLWPIQLIAAGGCLQ